GSKEKAAMPLHRHVSGAHAQDTLGVRGQFDLPAEVGEVPRFRLAATGVGPDVAYQIVHDELLLGGSERVNLATFAAPSLGRGAGGRASYSGSRARPPQTAMRGGLAEGDPPPNLVMGSNVQVCWEKFCRYFDVEARLVPVGPPDGKTTHLTPETAVAHCDEN